MASDAAPQSEEALVLARAQQRLEERRAAQGIARQRRPGDVILSEVLEGVERRARAARTTTPAAPAKPDHPPLEDERAVGDDPLGEVLPEGIYSLAFKGFDVARSFGRVFWVAHMSVTTEGPHHGRIVPRFYNPPRSGRRLARSSNLWRDFVALTGRRPPSEGFGPAWLLLHCVVSARVVTVSTRSEEGKLIELAECERYSRVKALLAIESGSPPALTGSQEGRKVQRKKP